MKKILTSIVVILLFTSNLNISAHKTKNLPPKKSKEIALIKTIGGIVLTGVATIWSLGGIAITLGDKNKIKRYVKYKISKENDTYEPSISALAGPGILAVTSTMGIIGFTLAKSGLNDLKEIAQERNTIRLIHNIRYD